MREVEDAGLPKDELPRLTLRSSSQIDARFKYANSDAIRGITPGNF